MTAFDVRPPAPLLKTANFSGGNQQKIVLAREIERNPKILLVGQPTRGVDIGAIEFIHKRIVAQRDAGKAVLLVSVELDEIFGALGPHHRDVRRPDHRRAAPGGDERAGSRPPDGGRERARRMSAPLKPASRLGRRRAHSARQRRGGAFVISGLVVLAIGENPLAAVQSLILGALGDLEGIGYTLYYATNFIFTGLAVAIRFHAGLFNIGGEGQAYIAGLGAALVCAALRLPARATRSPRWRSSAAALFGAALGRDSRLALQAERDSHIVITTIMFNFIASALMGYLLVNVMRKPGQMNAGDAAVPRHGAWMPQFHDAARPVGITMADRRSTSRSCWRSLAASRSGSSSGAPAGAIEMRTVGANPTARRLWRHLAGAASP